MYTSPTLFIIVASLNTAIDGAALVSPLAVEELPAADEEFGPSIHSEVEANEGSKGPRADSDFAKIILSGHAAIRKERKASDMMHLSWDQNLADLAAKHADQCKYEHGTLLLTDNTVVGQNIARSTWSKEKGEFPAASHVDNWQREIKYFSNKSATCEEMGHCGHYSQMVWARTSRVGCAHKICPELQGGSDMIVCNYLPFGNEPGPAYKTNGSPCSDCNLKGGTACVDNQCVDCEKHPSFVRDHQCRTCDPNRCLDLVSFCGDVFEKICENQMWQSFDGKNCRKFCHMCDC